MILGDDDMLGENVVEAFYKNLKEVIKNKSNVVKYASQIRDVTKNSISNIFENEKLEDAAAFYFRRFKGLCRSSLSEHIFKREVFLKYGFKNYPLAWHSDDYAWLDFSENKAIYCINEAIITVATSIESISGNSNNLQDKNFAEFLFYFDIINNKLQLFTKYQRRELVLQAEVSMKKAQNVSSSRWLILAKEYLYDFSLIRITKFIRRILIYKLK